MSNKRRNIRRFADLLERHDFRPLSTRSLLLSYLLGTHPPELPADQLVAFGEHFGVRAGTVRTTLSRMVASGDLTTTDADYRLTDRLIERQRQQDDGTRATPTDWDGAWWTAIAVGGDRTMTERRHFRAAMTGARMGELRPDIWMRPANTDAPCDAPGLIVTRGPLMTGDGAALAGALWEVPAIEARAAELVDALADLSELLDDDPGHLPVAFDVSAVCVRFLRAEPQLPPELADQPQCRALRSAYLGFNDRFRRDVRALLQRSP